jgi:ketosteroid isomerase-like protein
MSQENVEIARRGAEAAFRRPAPDFDAINELYHPEHEMVSLADRLEGGVVKGSSGYRAWIASNAETWESWDAAITDVVAVDRDRVLVQTVFTATSKRGGVPVRQPIAAIITIRNGRIVRSDLYGSRAEALEAVGLQE